MPRRVMQWMNNFGYGRFILKSDQKPCITDFQQAIKDEKLKSFDDISKYGMSLLGMDEEEECTMIIDGSYVGESTSNGIVYNTVRNLPGQMRSIKLFAEYVSSNQLELNPNAWQWICAFATETFNRCKIVAKHAVTHARWTPAQVALSNTQTINKWTVRVEHNVFHKLHYNALL